MKKLILFCLLSFSLIACASSIDDVDNNTVDFGKYTSFSKAVEGENKIFPKDAFIVKNKEYLDALSRMGEEDKEFEIRMDMVDTIKSMNLSERDSDIAIALSRLVQTIMYLTRKEMVDEDKVVKINAAMTGLTMCVYKNVNTKDLKKNDYLEVLERAIVNNKERAEHYKFFEEVTSYYLQENKNMYAQVLVLGYEFCHGNKPSEKELMAEIERMKFVNQ